MFCQSRYTKVGIIHSTHQPQFSQKLKHIALIEMKCNYLGISRFKSLCNIYYKTDGRWSLSLFKTQQTDCIFRYVYLLRCRIREIQCMHTLLRLDFHIDTGCHDLISGFASDSVMLNGFILYAHCLLHYDIAHFSNVEPEAAIKGRDI